MRMLSLFLIFLSPPAWAEMQTKLSADLNGNEVPEFYELLVNEENIVTLLISEDDAEPIEAADIAWKGGLYGQEPELELAPNGSVRVISQNEGCCRHRWRQTLTLAYRQGAIRVAGMTYQWRDTLDLDLYGTCDVNLLTGKGVAENGGRSPKWFAVPAVAPRVTDWTLDASLPEACEIQ
ncbi:MAG: hypothetical protein JXQ85_02020 [Cognatishimia sp.]|uniref:hypothetical protein n=1 Tax=Cognatishimia sp. TaxID=2211648 RepID=UPI003B8C5828